MIILIFSVFILILTFGLWFNKTARIYTDQRYSIIIACKNEEKNLPDLLISLSQIDYDKRNYEIIFCDDNSTDKTFEILQEFCLNHSQYHALRLNHPLKGKKQALEKAISFTLYDYIVLTDADCIAPNNWLSEINKYIDLRKEKQADMLIGYSPEINNSLFRKFTYLITATMYACTCGLKIPFSCTGRNLVIKKRTFIELEGYKGIIHIQSGDDKLLLNKFYKAGKKIGYMYTPAVETLPVAKNIRKHQDLRRYGKFHMSRLLWQIVSVAIALFFFYLPYDVFINHNYENFIIYFFACMIYTLTSAYCHQEKFHTAYFLFIIIYPYFLIYKSVKGLINKWTWK